VGRNLQLWEIGAMTNLATERNGASQTPTQPIAVAYFSRKPVAVDQYLCREGTDGFVPVMVAAALIAAALLLALD
jgi:hypothetical protein